MAAPSPSRTLAQRSKKVICDVVESSATLPEVVWCQCWCAARPDRSYFGSGYFGFDGSAHPALAARYLLHPQHRCGADGDDGGGLHDQAAGLCGLPLGAAADHADALVAQRGIDPRGADGRPHRPRRCGRGDRGLWSLPDWRQLCRGPDRFQHPGGHQLCGDYQGCRAYCRSLGPLHAGRHARQADGGGCRPERRSD